MQKEYDGDIPDTVEKLCKLPGVGPKMAHICMKTSWGLVTGIGNCLYNNLMFKRIGFLKIISFKVYSLAAIKKPNILVCYTGCQ